LHLSDDGINSASTFDKLVQVGDIAADIGKIMNNIGTVMSTVNLATSLFGGSGNGLEGFSGTGSYTSPFASYLASPGYLGLTSSDVFSDSGAAVATAADLGTRVSQYQAAWTTIGGAASAAEAALTSLENSCSDQAAVARTALSTQVEPVLTLYDTAQATIATANALIAKMRVDAQSTDPYSSAYADDLVIAQTTPPSAGDIANAEQQATVFGTATAGTGTRSLTVTASSYLDQMNLIATNAFVTAGSARTCLTIWLTYWSLQSRKRLLFIAPRSYGKTRFS